MKYLELLRIFLFLILLSNTSKAQGGFKKFYYLAGSLNSTACDVIEIPGGKFLVAGRTDTLVGSNFVSRLTFLAIDQHGNELWSRSYGNKNFDFPDLAQRNIFYCPDSNTVFLYCTGRDNLGNIFAVVTKLKYNGDTIWQKRFTDPLANMVPQVMIKARDGGYYLNGYYNVKAGGQPIFLVRISDDGNQIWKKVINKVAPNVMSGTDMLQDSASGKIIIAGYQYVGTNSASYSSVLFLDSLGNKINHVTYNNACGGAAGTVISLEDGNFVTGVQMSIDCDNGTYQAKLVKFDIDGKLLFQKSIFPFGPLNSIDFRKEKPNKDLVSIGVIDSAYFTRFKYVIFSSNGNIKMQSAFGRLMDVFVPDLGRGGSFTSDGGYITAMQVRPQPSPAPFYIIKLDSMGCDTVPWYCDWEKTVALKQQAQTLQAELFPNPCRDVLNIGVSPEGLPATVNVFDQSGRKVMLQEVSRSKNTLDVSTLPDGFYLMEVRSATGVFRSNFVVQR